MVEKLDEQPVEPIKDRKGKVARWKVTYPSNFAVLPQGIEFPIKQGKVKYYGKYPMWVDQPALKPYRHLLVVERVEVEVEAEEEKKEAKPPKKK